jgi:hypothetical protein
MSPHHDPLERFIRKNRNAFDPWEPHPSVWERLEHQLALEEAQRKKGIVVRLFPTVRRFAAALAVLLISIFAYWSGTLNPDVSPSAEAALPAEIQELEYFYSGQMLRQEQQMRGFSEAPQGLEAEFSLQLEQLQTEQEALKQDILRYGQVPALHAALTQNLQAQVELLQKKNEILQYVHQTTPKK